MDDRDRFTKAGKSTLQEIARLKASRGQDSEVALLVKDLEDVLQGILDGRPSEVGESARSWTRRRVDEIRHDARISLGVG